MQDIAPANATEAADIVSAAQERAETIEIVGNGSKRGLGRPVAARHVLSARNLSGISLYEPDELVLIAGAGTPLAEIEDALARHHQELAFEPADWRGLWGTGAAQTIGGIVATNLSGPRRPFAGALRDHLLGFTAVNGRGEVVKSGSRVVKNVTGYDLSKLIAGSYGTLVFLTEIILKVLPRPDLSATLMLPGLGARGAVTAMAKAASTPLSLSGAAWSPGSGVALRLEGSAGGLAERMAELRRWFGGFAQDVLDDGPSRAWWRDMRDLAPFAAHDSLAIWRVSVAPSSGAEVLAAFPGAPALLDWAGGLVWLALPQDEANVRARLKPFGGNAMRMRGTGTADDILEPLDAGLEMLTRRVKASFDPNGLFNPGRMYPDI